MKMQDKEQYQKIATYILKIVMLGLFLFACLFELC